jgi:hypothetical protein
MIMRLMHAPSPILLNTYNGVTPYTCRCIGIYTERYTRRLHGAKILTKKVCVRKTKKDLTLLNASGRHLLVWVPYWT